MGLWALGVVPGCESRLAVEPSGRRPSQRLQRRTESDSRSRLALALTEGLDKGRIQIDKVRGREGLTRLELIRRLGKR